MLPLPGIDLHAKGIYSDLQRRFIALIVSLELYGEGALCDPTRFKAFSHNDNNNNNNNNIFIS